MLQERVLAQKVHVCVPADPEDGCCSDSMRHPRNGGGILDAANPKAAPSNTIACGMLRFGSTSALASVLDFGKGDLFLELCQTLMPSLCANLGRKPTFVMGKGARFKPPPPS